MIPVPSICVRALPSAATHALFTYKLLSCFRFQSAVVLNMSPSSPTSSSSDNAHNNGVTTEYQFGLFCVASASMLSGLSAALTQRALSGTQSRHTMLYSAEMAVYGIVFLLGNLMVNSDIQAGSTLWAHWDLSTMFPVITNVRHVIMCYGISICLLL